MLLCAREGRSGTGPGAGCVVSRCLRLGGLGGGILGLLCSPAIVSLLRDRLERA